MNLHLLVPALFWPDATLTDIYHDLPLPALENFWQILSIDDEPERLEAWLCRAFGVAKQLDWPVAPITLLGDGKAILSRQTITGFVPTLCICISSGTRSCWLTAVSFQFRQTKPISLPSLLNRHFADNDRNSIFARYGPIAGICG